MMALDPVDHSRGRHDPRAIFWLALAMVLGIAVRLPPLLRTDFPLMDGGLFYAMVRDLQASGFALPAYTSYNAAGIPFVYPPLGLYLAAALQAATGWRLEDLFRWLPLVVNLATIPAFYALSRAVLTSKQTAAAATIIFALMPEPAHWMVMGGGVTRSLGYLFAILALRSIYLVYVRARPGDVVLSALFSAGAVLSHPQMGWFVAYSAVVMFIAFGRNRRGLINSLLVALGVLAVTSPWWGTVLTRHGAAPLLAATRHGWPVFSGLTWLFVKGATGEPFIPLVAFAAMLGIITCLLKRCFWLPAWLLATFALDGWVPTTTGAVPLALLAGIGVVEALWPLLAGTPGREAQASSTPDVPGKRQIAAQLTLVLLAGYVVLAGMFANALTLSSLSADEREAMRWVAQNTPPSSRFLVVTSERWPVDRSSEWFPLLAERRSVGTVQGSEWLPGGEFARRVEGNTDLLACPQEGVDCLERWIQDRGNGITHVYIPKRRAALYSTMELLKTEVVEDPCRLLRDALAANPRYSVIYDNTGATVFHRRETGSEAEQQ